MHNSPWFTCALLLERAHTLAAATGVQSAKDGQAAVYHA